MSRVEQLSLREFLVESSSSPCPKYDREVSKKYCDFLADLVLSVSLSFNDFLRFIWGFLTSDMRILQSFAQLPRKEKEVMDNFLMNLVLFFLQGYYDDLLGLVHMELIGQIQAQKSGQFYTPFPLAEVYLKWFETFLGLGVW